jgi:hypothetical protein
MKKHEIELGAYLYRAVPAANGQGWMLRCRKKAGKCPRWFTLLTGGGTGSTPASAQLYDSPEAALAFARVFDRLG